MLAACAGPLRRQAKLLEKEKFDRVEKKLTKILEKDSINPGALYLFSRLYNDPAFEKQSLDTAYLFALQSLKAFELAEEKTLKKLDKAAIDSLDLVQQKEKLDSLAFQRAATEHDIDAYNNFLSRYPTADQVVEAIERRNAIAFAEATRINTYESYKLFMETYPDAAELRDAKELYDILLFESKTKSKTLASYIQFLKDYPATPYREEAEKHIFQISTADNAIKSYLGFIAQYPRSRFAKRASDKLFYKYTQQKTAQEFIENYRHLPGGDSLAAAVASQRHPVFPILEDDRFGFMDSQGKVLIPPTFTTIPEAYKCGGIGEDYLVITSPRSQIISRTGSVIYTGPFDTVTDLGMGLLKIQKGDHYGLVHKAGYIILQPVFDDISLINDQFIRFLNNGLFGLKTISGRDILPPEYHDIYAEDEFIILEKNQKLAITNARQLEEKVNQKPHLAQFSYDEVALIADGFMQAFDGNLETVLDHQLKPVIPNDAHHIYHVKYGWLIEKSNGFVLYDENLVPLADEPYQEAMFNKNWMGLKKGALWGIMGHQGAIFPSFQYDSIRLLSANVALLFQDDVTSALFFNGIQVNIKGYDYLVQLLRSPSLDTDTVQMEFFLAANKQGFKRIYNYLGEEILSGMYTTVNALSPKHLVVERGSRKSLIDYQGKTLLPMRYDGIANYNQGYISTLIGTKFGLFNAETNVTISPQYDVMLQPYGNATFTARKKNKWGVIDGNDKSLIPFSYDDIRYWTDSVALAQKNGLWHLVDINTREILYEDIESYTLLGRHKDATIISIYKNGQYGILSSEDGEVIAPTFQDIVNLGAGDEMIFFAEKAAEEENISVGIYYDGQGKLLRRQAFIMSELYEIVCD